MASPIDYQIPLKTQELITKLARVIYKNNRSNYLLEFEDLQQEAYLAYYNGARTKVRFYGAMVDLLRRMNPGVERKSHTEPHFAIEFTQGLKTLSDNRPKELSEIERQAIREQLDRARDKNPRYAHILQMIREGYTWKEIAEYHHVSEARISQLLTQERRKHDENTHHNVNR